MADVFISYSRRDLGRVDPIASKLESLGYDVWLDKELPSGSEYAKTIAAEIDRAKCVVVVWSRSSCDSTWVYAESSTALDAKKLAQVCIDPVKLPLPFGALHYANLMEADKAALAWQQLEDAVDKLVRAGMPIQVEAAPRRARPNPALRGADGLTAALMALAVIVFAAFVWMASRSDFSPDVQANLISLLPYGLGAVVALAVLATLVVMSRMFAIARAGG